MSALKTIATAALVGLAGAGCTSTPPTPSDRGDWYHVAATVHAERSLPAPPGHLGWPTSMPRVDRSANELTPGDELVLALVHDRPDADSRTWWFRLTGLEPDDEGRVPIRVETVDGDGNALATTTTLALPANVLRDGLHAMTSTYVETRRANGSGTLTGFGAVFALFAIVESNRVLGPILRDVIEAPSVWSVVASLGVTASISCSLGRTEPWPTAGNRIVGRAPRYRTEMAIKANDRPALLCSVITAEPRAPLQLAAGVVSVVGMHPSDPRHRIVLGILGARLADAR